MTSKDPLILYIQKSIDDLISSLKRRIHINDGMRSSLNRSTPFTPNSNRLVLNHAREAQLRHYRNIDQIIFECNTTIQKMYLLQAAIHQVENKLLMHLLAHHYVYSCKEMHYCLQSNLCSQLVESNTELLLVA